MQPHNDVSSTALLLTNAKKVT